MFAVSSPINSRKAAIVGYNAGTLFACAAALGVVLAALAVRIQPTVEISLFHTYFVVVHFHLLSIAIVLHGLFAVVYFTFPSLTRSPWKQTLGRLHFWLTAGATAIIGSTPFVVYRMALSHELYDAEEVLGSGIVFLLVGQVPFFLLFARDRVNRL